MRLRTFMCTGSYNEDESGFRRFGYKTVVFSALRWQEIGGYYYA